MELNADKLLFDCIRDGIRDGIAAKFKQTYNKPMNQMIDDAIGSHRVELTKLISDSIGSLLGDDLFRSQIQSQVSSLLAKQLVQKFGGELEKQVNALKSDPATRARITLAIDSIVSNKT